MLTKLKGYGLASIHAHAATNSKHTMCQTIAAKRNTSQQPGDDAFVVVVDAVIDAGQNRMTEAGACGSRSEYEDREGESGKQALKQHFKTLLPYI